MELGTYIDYQGRPAVRFERTYPHSIDCVWAAITEPDELAAWFPSRVTHEGRTGGVIEFAGDPYSDPSAGRIIAFEPKTTFSCTWGADELHFTLDAVGESTRLVLINVLEAADAAARNASGWTICLAELDKVVAGVRGDGPHSEEAGAAFEGIMKAYVAAGMPAGAEIPDKRD